MPYFPDLVLVRIQYIHCWHCLRADARMAAGFEDAAEERRPLLPRDGEAENLVARQNRGSTSEIDWRRLASDFELVSKHAFVALFVSLLPSAFDIITDGRSGGTFIHGTDYIKNVASPNDSSVANNASCTLTGEFVIVTDNGTEEVDFYQYRCFEKDKVYGVMTWVLMILPGVWSYDIYTGMGWQARDKRCLSYFLFWLLYIASICFFPLLVLGVKFAGLFNPGDEMKKLTGRVNELEGTYESTLQFGLQLFIMLSRKDRMLSHLQWTTISTLTTSFLMVNKAGVQSYLQYENPNQAEENMSRTALQFTMFITANAFKLGSGALLVTMFSYWTIPAYFTILLGGLVLATFVNRPETRPLHWRHMPFHPVALIRFGPRLWAPWGNLEFSEEERMRSLFRGNLVWFAGTSLLLTAAFALAVFDPNMRIPTFDIKRGAVIEYKLSDRGTLVTETGPSLTFILVFVALLASGLASLVLIHLEAKEAESWSLYWLVGLIVMVTVMIIVMVVTAVVVV